MSINKSSNNSFENHLKSCRIKRGNSIRDMGESMGLNQEKLAEIMKISRTTISKIENGKFNCSIDYLSKFSWFLEFELLFKEK